MLPTAQAARAPVLATDARGDDDKVPGHCQGGIKGAGARVKGRRRTLVSPQISLTEICGRSLKAHRITSSARISTDWGIVRPRALAVFRLMTNSNLVGCSTGRSAGLAPLRILST